MGNKKYNSKNNKEMKKRADELNAQLPDEVKDDKTGKVYKKGKDYEADFTKEILCECKTLKKLGYGHYLCTNCKKIFEIPFTMQYSFEEILNKFDGIVKNAKKEIGDSKKSKKA
jgi:hypothetical protein